MARKKLTVNPPAVLATTVPYVPQTPVSKEQLGKMREEALAYFRSEATYYGHGMVPPFNVAARVEGILGAVDLESARVALQKAKSAGLMSLLAAWATKKIPGPDTSENWMKKTREAEALAKMLESKGNLGLARSQYDRADEFRARAEASLKRGT